MLKFVDEISIAILQRFLGNERCLGSNSMLLTTDCADSLSPSGRRVLF